MTPSLPRWLDVGSVTPSYGGLGLPCRDDGQPCRADGSLQLLGGLQEYHSGQGLSTGRRNAPLLLNLFVDELLRGLNQGAFTLKDMPITSVF
jgi:hypothetical protein